MNILEAFSRSKAGKAVLLEAESKTLASRQRWCAEIRELSERGEAQGKELARCCADAEKKLSAAREQLRQAENTLSDARAEWSAFSHSIQRGINLARNELTESAPPLIDLWLTKLHNNWEAARLIHDIALPARNYSGNETIPAAKRISRSEAIHQAIEAIRALKLEALTDSELESRIAAIVAGIPSEWAAAS